jgi:hypothetical protein
MIRSKLIPLISSIIIGLVLFATGCDSTDSTPEMGSMTVEMTDAPIDSAAEVNVFVESIEVNNADTDTGWVTIAEPQQMYNLLDYTNGEVAVLGGAELEAGTYNQIRLILGDGNNLVVYNDDETTSTYDLFVPSGAQSGLKLNVNAEIEAGIEYTLLLDFDASRSVHKAGNNPNHPYILRPTIKAINKAITGAISGNAQPAEAKPLVYAIANSDTLASTIADTTSGDYQLIGLEEGTYDVSFNSRNDAYGDTTVNDISVTIGEVTEMDTVRVSQN